MTQKENIKKHLEDYGAITPIEALNLYGCFRLGARIYDLKEDGMEIETEMVQDRKKRYAKYIYEK